MSEASPIQPLNPTPPMRFFYVDRQQHRHTFLTETLYKHPTAPGFVCGYTDAGRFLTVSASSLQTEPTHDGQQNK